MFIQYLGGDMLSSFVYENQRYEVTLGDTASMEYARYQLEQRTNQLWKWCSRGGQFMLYPVNSWTETPSGNLIARDDNVGIINPIVFPLMNYV